MITPWTGQPARRADRREDRAGRRATGYDRDGLGPLLVSWQRQALTRLHLVTGDRFLDIGCATGGAVRAAAQQVRVAVGVDQSPNMIAHARGRSRSAARAHYTLSRAEHLPFPAHTFTAVLCTTVLHYLDNPDHAIAEMTRVLRPEGRLVIGDLQHRALATAGPPHHLPHAWTGLTVTHHWHTLTPFGVYVILLARPAA